MVVIRDDGDGRMVSGASIITFGDAHDIHSFYKIRRLLQNTTERRENTLAPERERSHRQWQEIVDAMECATSTE
jgi:hypothetical protein